jgi:hypothetical protein
MAVLPYSLHPFQFVDGVAAVFDFNDLAAAADCGLILVLFVGRHFLLGVEIGVG